MHDVIVVGAGLFGQAVTGKLRSIGMDVLMIDSKKEGAGSPPSAGLMKPGWFASMGKEIYEPALQTLDELYGLHDLKFKIGPKMGVTVHWADPNQVLGLAPDSTEEVVRAIPAMGDQPAMVIFADGHMISAKRIVVAAGVWTKNLIDVPSLDGKVGTAYLWKGESIETPFIDMWAPYKQLKAFNRGDGLWVGDATAIKQSNWNDDYEKRSEKRCSKAVGLRIEEATRLYGIRPATSKKANVCAVTGKQQPCYLAEHGTGLFAATGGSKNGMIAAGWVAHELARRFSDA